MVLLPIILMTLAATSGITLIAVTSDSGFTNNSHSSNDYSSNSYSSMTPNSYSASNNKDYPLPDPGVNPNLIDLNTQPIVSNLNIQPIDSQSQQNNNNVLTTTSSLSSTFSSLSSNTFPISNTSSTYSLNSQNLNKNNTYSFKTTNPNINFNNMKNNQTANPNKKKIKFSKNFFEVNKEWRDVPDPVTWFGDIFNSNTKLYPTSYLSKFVEDFHEWIVPDEKNPPKEVPSFDDFVKSLKKGIRVMAGTKDKIEVIGGGIQFLSGSHSAIKLRIVKNDGNKFLKWEFKHIFNANKVDGTSLMQTKLENLLGQTIRPYLNEGHSANSDKFYIMEKLSVCDLMTKHKIKIENVAGIDPRETNIKPNWTEFDNNDWFDGLIDVMDIDRLNADRKYL